jgi:hypothetical protein
MLMAAGEGTTLAEPAGATVPLLGGGGKGTEPARRQEEREEEFEAAA